MKKQINVLSEPYFTIEMKDLGKNKLIELIIYFSSYKAKSYKKTEKELRKLTRDQIIKKYYFYLFEWLLDCPRKGE